MKAWARAFAEAIADIDVAVQRSLQRSSVGRDPGHPHPLLLVEAGEVVKEAASAVQVPGPL